MIIRRNYLFVLIFQNNKDEVFFTDSEEDLIRVGIYLGSNKHLLIKEIKQYDPIKTRFTRANKNLLKNLFKFATDLDLELKRRNFYGLTGY